MTSFLRQFVGWIVAAFHSREELIPENLALRQQLLAMSANPRRRLSTGHKLFLDWPAKTLVGMETVAHPGYAQNSCDLASDGLPAVLEMALTR